MVQQSKRLKEKLDLRWDKDYKVTRGQPGSLQISDTRGLVM